jgi:hypothetical protein
MKHRNLTLGAALLAITPEVRPDSGGMGGDVWRMMQSGDVWLL